MITISNFEKVFQDEKLLEKVASASTREEAKKACKEKGLELSDEDLEEIAGGLNKTVKIVLSAIGVTAAAVLTAAAGYSMMNKSSKKENDPVGQDSASQAAATPAPDVDENGVFWYDAED